MYAVLRQYKIKAGSADTVSKRAQEGFVPIIKGLPGFVAYYGVVVNDTTLFTVSIFDDQAGEERSTREAATWVNQNLAQYVEGAPQVSAGQVAWSSKK